MQCVEVSAVSIRSHLVVGNRHASIHNLADSSNIHVGQANLHMAAAAEVAAAAAAQIPMVALLIVNTLELHPPLYPYINIQPHTYIHALNSPLLAGQPRAAHIK
jgi:hypothetical protein